MLMETKNRRKVILITDGDNVARQAIEEVARNVGGRCISLSGGNPTPLSGEEIVQLILQAAYDPVLVMFDDNGFKRHGVGEQALEAVANHPAIEVIGAVAVASHTDSVDGTLVDLTIDNKGNMIHDEVDKAGDALLGSQPVIHGDTVDVLNKLNIPMVVGIGDIGKMKGHDNFRSGAPITTKAVQQILEKNGFTLSS